MTFSESNFRYDLECNAIDIQSNLFITDIKGTGISVHIIEVSVLER